MEQSEERSETERHWDILSMTILTVTTAALAADVLHSGEPEPTAGTRRHPGGHQRDSSWTLNRDVCSNGGTGGHDNVLRKEPARREHWKQDRAQEAFSIFWAMLVPLAIMVSVTFIVPTIHSWYERDQTTQESTAVQEETTIPEGRPTQEPAPRQVSTTGTANPLETNEAPGPDD